MIEPDPLLSPDGRFRWNGAQWVPTPRQNRRIVLMVVAILCAVVGLPLILLALVIGPAIGEMFGIFY